MMYAITVATIMFAVTSSTGAFSLTYRFAAGAQRSLGRHVCRMATTAPSPEVSTPSSPAASAAGEHGANSLPIVTLERGKARIFQDGNPLVYGGAVKKVTGDARGGSFVTVHDHFGNSIGKGVFNPDSTYRVRMLTRATEVENSYDFPEIVETRLQDAVMLRRAINLPSQTDTAYRLVNGEGDRLSGLIVDVFNHVIVIQSSAVWVETHRDVIEEAMQRVFAAVPKHADEDGAARDYEVIWRRAESRLNQDGFTGDKSQEKTNIGEITVYENGVSYVVNLDDGQKTGFYCDQRENRQMIRQLSKGKTVLDTFSYTGGFGLNAALGGATSVTTVESSALACELINKNAALNGVSERVAAVKSDAVAFMRQEAEEHKTYDIGRCVRCVLCVYV
jgi:23S rRNA (cytosine1962-C5)-methyltransferase